MSPNPRSIDILSEEKGESSTIATTNNTNTNNNNNNNATARILQKAIANGQLTDDQPVALFMDTDQFREECQGLIDAFPPNSLHGFACKACPVVGILQTAMAVGMGGECASEGEVALCLAAGIEASNIILDSPCKTDTVIRKMLNLGVHMNADSLTEVQRIQAILKYTHDNTNNTPTSSIGLRINPQTGTGTIGMTSTAGAANKFGVPLQEARAEIIQAFQDCPFLTCVHVHVGSQGVSPQQLVDGAKAAVELAQQVNAQCPGRVTTIDIGGGLSVDYGDDDDDNINANGQRNHRNNNNNNNKMISMATYARMLREQVPELFDYRIITEFGRRLAAPCGFLATRIQALKQAGGRQYVIGHVGADLLMRAVYAPHQWRHPLTVYNAQGKLKQTNVLQAVDVAGPLCFSGDIIAKDRFLPADTAVGDHLVVGVAGGYTISIYSRHTSQLVPAVYGYNGGASEQEEINLTTLKKAETLQDLVRFWGGGC